MPKFNCALTCEVPQMAEWARLSAKDQHFPYCMGKNSLPHITLFPIEAENGEEILNTLKKAPTPPTIEFSGYYVHARKDANQYYFGLRVRQTPELVAFQKELANLFPSVEEKRLAPLWFPHLTLGMVEDENRIPDLKPWASCNQTASTRLILGESASYGRLPHILGEGGK